MYRINSEFVKPIETQAKMSGRDCSVLKKKENNQNPVANFSRRLYKKNKIFAGNIIC